MATKNDERIMKLKETIEQKREKLKKKNSRFIPLTNCMLVLDKVTYNLHVDTSDMLLVKLNTIRMSVENLGLDTSTFMISGYSLDDWMIDVKNNLAIQNYKVEKRKLDNLEKQLTSLLSDDKQTELQIDNLATLLEQ